ncbi:hypothetical protein OSTOST_21676 [Ostertagia ostertagi]
MSQYSSSEHLSEMLECMRVGTGRFDSNDSCPSNEDPSNVYRPRSRSLTSPIKLHSDFHLDVVNRNSVYKERFPKAKVQMEEKLAAFVAEQAPLSGGSSTGDNDTGQEGVNNRRSMVASDCLARSRDETISCSYFCEMSQRLDETLNEEFDPDEFYHLLEEAERCRKLRSGCDHAWMLNPEQKITVHMLQRPPAVVTSRE